jgi:biopolymer transport protein ExbB/TolQ
MTINNKPMSVPPWMASIIMGVITAAFVAWGVISVSNVRITRAEQDIQQLQSQKADTKDIDMVYDLLKELKADIKEIKNGTPVK